MAPTLKQILESLDAQLRTATGRSDWRITAYTVDQDSTHASPWSLKCVESRGGESDAVIEFVANAACVTHTTVVGDVAKIVDSLKHPSQIEQYRQFGGDQVALVHVVGDPHGSVIGSPCFDPWQTITNARVLGRVIGALGVGGDVSPQEIVANADWRYLVEQYAKAVASFLRPRPAALKFFIGADWTLPDLQIVPHGNDFTTQNVGEVVKRVDPSTGIPKYERTEVFPHEAVRITSFSDEFEPYTSRGERWLQFGPGLVLSKSGLEAFARGWSQRQHDQQYIQGLDKISW
jgi:hypothetical protein